LENWARESLEFYKQRLINEYFVTETEKLTNTRWQGKDLGQVLSRSEG
jgi:hypothetical protein